MKAGEWDGEDRENFRRDDRMTSLRRRLRLGETGAKRARKSYGDDNLRRKRSAAAALNPEPAAADKCRTKNNLSKANGNTENRKQEHKDEENSNTDQSNRSKNHDE